MKGLTIKQLKEACDKLIKEGKGDKHILISSDDEGNEYHELFFAFNDKLLDEFKDCTYPPFVRVPQEEWDDYIILG